MGKHKTNLTRGDRFGLLKATELAAEMIGEYERARAPATELRIESLSEAEWDDVVAIKADHLDKWQVKRVMAGFAIEDLASLIGNANMQSSGTRLHFGVASYVPVISGRKEICGLQKIAELCAEAQKPGIRMADFMHKEISNVALKAMREALGGADDEHVFGTLLRLRIVLLGLEFELRAKAVQHLSDIFINADAVVDALHSWVLQNNDGAISVTPDLLYKQIIERIGIRDPSRQTWIHLKRNTVTLSWESRGPLSVDSLVKQVWGTSGVRVQFGVPPFSGEAASSCLSRLVLHRTAGSMPEMSPEDSVLWRIRSTELCGGTLGSSTDPLEFPHRSLDHEPLCPPREARNDGEFAKRVSDQMNAWIWSELLEDVARRLHGEAVADDLREQMKLLWLTWMQQLPSDATRINFIRSMLTTAEEWSRAGFDSFVRTGPAQVKSLGESILIALAVGVGLSRSGAPITIDKSLAITNMSIGSTAAHVIALRTASNPLDRRPLRLADGPGAVFALEPGLTILGLIEASANDLYGVACADATPYHASEQASQSYRHVGIPFPIVTASPLLRRAMKSGLDNLRAHLNEIISPMVARRDAALRATVDAVVL